MERPVNTRAADFTITVSLGAAVYSGDENTRPEDFLNLADQACYRAKEQGRNRLVLGG